MNNLLLASEEFGIKPTPNIVQIVILCVIVLGLLRTRKYPDQAIRYLWAAMIALPAALVITKFVSFRPLAEIFSVLSLTLAILSLVINRPNRWAKAHPEEHKAEQAHGEQRLTRAEFE